MPNHGIRITPLAVLQEQLVTALEHGADGKPKCPAVAVALRREIGLRLGFDDDHSTKARWGRGRHGIGRADSIPHAYGVQGRNFTG